MADFTSDGVDRTTTLKITGMTCGHCVTHVTQELEAVKGVKNVSVVLNAGGLSSSSRMAGSSSQRTTVLLVV